jgi:hypothetical protein
MIGMTFLSVLLLMQAVKQADSYLGAELMPMLMLVHDVELVGSVSSE